MENQGPRQRQAVQGKGNLSAYNKRVAMWLKNTYISMREGASGTEQGAT